MEIDISPDPARLTRKAADLFVARAKEAMERRGRFAVAFSGGSTPKALFALLATPEYVGRVDWSRVHLFWGDERCVGPDDPKSNFKMTKEALLDHVPLPTTNIHRIYGEDDPFQSAKQYEQEIRTFFGGGDTVPAFDLVLLGMGDNGHTASLFPGTWSVREKVRWVVEQYVEVMTMWRVTFTAPLINAAEHVAFLVSGPGKADMLAKVLQGLQQPDVLPAQLIQPAKGLLHWLVDAPAAAQLKQ